jgi:hypothetical protein
MPSRPDLREIASNVKDAFSEMDRDALLEILTFVVKEYVVEGPPPMLIHQAETLSDLKNLSFAQLITSLQTRFDFPELAMFVVDGEQVGVRIGGVVQPLLAQRQPAPQMIDTRPQPGVRVVETPLQQRLPGPTNPSTQPGSLPARPAGQVPAPSTAAAAAPPPSRGLSVRGAPTGGASGGAPAAAPAQPAAPAAPAAGAAPAQPSEDKKEGSGDDASARFSLLELD